MINSSTIVFITGAYVSHACWDQWQTYFQHKGYNTMAPPWPGKDADTKTLRERYPDKQLAAVSMDDIINQYISIINKLPEKPVVIGHSFGGLFAQVLLNRGYAAAGVAIHAVMPQGIIPYEYNFLKSNLPLLASLNSTYLMPFSRWQFAFTNGMPLEVQQQTYEQLVIPESRKAALGGLTKAAYVDFKKPHPPLLMMAGTEDQCIPAHLCKRVYNSYKDRNSITDFVVKDRNHFVLGQPEWEQDAEEVAGWLRRN
ncbi:Pimeloyl-ACP methyl ester carboxylesterase [Chitinophaga jiangningensis]|uniref:Pimeloyl-ACP methyl ester carboxylesterase n=1 Tax=Chitinophaga jiangningensis TaxID=1419482 RepID=A0A1M6XU97_9BACT|nr:alpha/beta hydrolase [Chitinophaga jiangningensis]SHL09590.1 Pimeloyl-ACP methyl ester carboxylesterase [Chitinophaga jiangningensis]